MEEQKQDNLKKTNIDYTVNINIKTNITEENKTNLSSKNNNASLQTNQNSENKLKINIIENDGSAPYEGVVYEKSDNLGVFNENKKIDNLNDEYNYEKINLNDTDELSIPNTKKSIKKQINTDRLNKKNKSKNRVIKIILLFILLVPLLIIIYYKIKPNNKILTKVLIDEYAYLIHDIKFDDNIYQNLQKEPIIYTGTIDMKMNINNKQSELVKYENIINNLKLTYDVGLDYSNEKGYVKVDSKYENNELLNLNLYSKSNKSYVYLNNIFSKYIELDDFKIGSLYNNDIENRNDYEYIIKTLALTTLESIDEKYFKREKNLIILELNNETYKKILGKVIVNLLNNSEFIESYANITSKTKDEVINELENVNFNSVNIEKSIIYLNVDKYNRPIYIKMIIDKPDYQKEIIYNFEDIRTLSITDSTNNEKVTITYEKKNDGSAIEIKESKNKINITLDKLIKSKSTIRNFKMTIEDKKIIDGKLESTKDKLSKYNKLDLNIIADNQTINFIIDHNITTKNVEKIIIPKMENIVNYDNMTETDSKELNDSINSNTVLQKLLEDIKIENTDNIINYNIKTEE